MIGLTPQQQAAAHELGVSRAMLPMNVQAARQKLQAGELENQSKLQAVQEEQFLAPYRRAAAPYELEKAKMGPEALRAEIEGRRAGTAATQMNTFRSGVLLPVQRTQMELENAARKYELQPENLAIRREYDKAKLENLKANTEAINYELKHPEVRGATGMLTSGQIQNTVQESLSELTQEAFKPYVDEKAIITDPVTGRIVFKDPNKYNELAHKAFRDSVKPDPSTGRLKPAAAWLQSFIEGNLALARRGEGFTPQPIPGFTQQESYMIYRYMLGNPDGGKPGMSFNETMNLIFEASGGQ